MILVIRKGIKCIKLRKGKKYPGWHLGLPLSYALKKRTNKEIFQLFPKKKKTKRGACFWKVGIFEC